jgi:DNA-binding MarR family transcriptional regulator
MIEKAPARGAEATAKAHLKKHGIYGKSASVVSNIFRISNVIRSNAEVNLLQNYGMSFSGFTALWVLWVWGAMETNRLAEETGVAKSTLTGILKTLERNEYCQRRPHVSDGRRVVVEATAKGRELMQEIYPLFHELENQAVSQLSEADLDMTKDALRIILATVDGSNTAPNS